MDPFKCCAAVCLLLAGLAAVAVDALEEPLPERFLPPRDFNPHPFQRALQPGEEAGGEDEHEQPSGQVVPGAHQDPVQEPHPYALLARKRPREGRYPHHQPGDPVLYPHPITVISELHRSAARAKLHRSQQQRQQQQQQEEGGYYPLQELQSLDPQQEVYRQPVLVYQQPGAHPQQQIPQQQIPQQQIPQQQIPQQIAHQAPQQLQHDSTDNYAFSYSVRGTGAGDNFAHAQARSGGGTRGEYRVQLPDGRLQIVSYVADNHGYRADVRYDGQEQLHQSGAREHAGPSPAQQLQQQQQQQQQQQLQQQQLQQHQHQLQQYVVSPAPQYIAHASPAPQQHQYVPGPEAAHQYIVSPSAAPEHHQYVASPSAAPEHHQYVASPSAAPEHHQYVASPSAAPEHHQYVLSPSAAPEHHQYVASPSAAPEHQHFIVSPSATPEQHQYIVSPSAGPKQQYASPEQHQYVVSPSGAPQHAQYFSPTAATPVTATAASHLQYLTHSAATAGPSAASHQYLARPAAAVGRQFYDDGYFVSSTTPSPLAGLDDGLDPSGFAPLEQARALAPTTQAPPPDNTASPAPVQFPRVPEDTSAQQQQQQQQQQLQQQQQRQPLQQFGQSGRSNQLFQSSQRFNNLLLRQSYL